MSAQFAKRVLLVDNSQVVRTSARRLFEDRGWIVCGEANSGREGIEKAVELQPSLVLLDFSMPVMNGLTAARIMKQTMPETRLILFTSFSDLLNTEELESAGFSALVRKSEAAHLLAVAEQALAA